MPSSTSNSDGIPLRDVPDLPWGRAAALAGVLFLLALAGWEAHWRSEGFRPGARNSEGLWAELRRGVDRSEPDQTVLLGSSRMLFDIDLDAWEEETGVLPVQLALEGSNPRPFLSDLAEDPDFTGLAVVGVTPGLFASPGAGLRGGALERYRRESPSQWIGQKLSVPLERTLAFYDPDAALFAVVHRQTWWPEREGLPFQPRDVRRLVEMDWRREANMWTRIDDDPEYRELVRSIWRDFFENPPPPPPEEEARRLFDKMIRTLKTDVAAIRARGGDVVFVRPPSAEFLREIEAEAFPRKELWDRILAATDAVGVHFEDHPELADVSIPEASHVSARDKARFTRALARILREEFRHRGDPRPELEP